ncbi:hypothetical protein WDU94_011338 [Cyamophila willieti]
MTPNHSPKRKRDWSNVFVYWKWLIPFSQVWGLSVSIVLLGIGLHQAYNYHVTSGVNVILISAGVFSLESYWLFSRISQDKLDSTKFWQLLNDLQDPRNYWKKSLIYWLTSLLLFTTLKTSWVCEVSGVQLLILSSLYLLMCIQHLLMTQSTHVVLSSMFGHRTQPIFDEMEEVDEEMEVFNKTKDTSDSEPDQEDPNLVEILSVDQDPELTM